MEKRKYEVVEIEALTQYDVIRKRPYLYIKDQASLIERIIESLQSSDNFNLSNLKVKHRKKSIVVESSDPILTVFCKGNPSRSRFMLYELMTVMPCADNIPPLMGIGVAINALSKYCIVKGQDDDGMVYVIRFDNAERFAIHREPFWSTRFFLEFELDENYFEEPLSAYSMVEQYNEKQNL